MPQRAVPRQKTDRSGNGGPISAELIPPMGRRVYGEVCYVDPLSYVQVSLLRRLRDLPEDSPEREGVLKTLLLTVSGISSGLLNTG